MDIKTAMSTFGFGHRKSGHIIIEKNNELWLAAAPVAVGGFLPFGMSNLPGTLRVEPLENGEPAPYTYTVTEALLELTTEKGAKVRFAIDTQTQALRISGNCRFRLNAVEAAMFVTSMITNDGVSLSVGAIRYLICAVRGAYVFDDTWLLSQFHSVVPIYTVEPQNGEFELVLFDLPADTDVPAIEKSLDECAAENAAEFRAFSELLVSVPPQWEQVRQSAAYLLWLCHREIDGKEMLVENKYGSSNKSSQIEALASLAFKDKDKAVQLLLALPATSPLYAVIAARRLIDDNLLNDSRGTIYAVFAAIEKAARYWQTERAVCPDGLSFYAYRPESGAQRSPEFFKAGEPVYAPDLNAYLALAAHLLSELAQLELDVGIVHKWSAQAERLTRLLVSELWNGEDFVGKNAYTGELSGPDPTLSLAPIILGKRLPPEILEKLAAKISDETAGSAFGLTLVSELYDAGGAEKAEAIAQKTLERITADGLTCPFYGAAALSLAAKTLGEGK